MHHVLFFVCIYTTLRVALTNYHCFTIWIILKDIIAVHGCGCSISLDELEEKLSLASIWMDIKVKIRNLLDYEDEGQLKFDLSMHKKMLQDHSYRVPIYNKLPS